jgi:hypothetical protein
VRYIPDTTLAHYNAMPQSKLLDLSAIDCNLFGTNIKAYRSGQGPEALNEYAEDGKHLRGPDSEAVQFYLFNHLAALIRNRYTPNEKLPGWAVEVMREYKKVVAQQGLRMGAYMALITVRESRHLHEMGETWWKDTIVKPYGQKCRDFHGEIHGSSSTTAANALMDSAPHIAVGAFFKAIETMFFKGKFGGGYGGKPWGEITKCLTEFLHGKISQEMMIDTAYTLAHNNGPMFNKGMLYSEYTSFFRHLLDVQRSGQIPEMCLETTNSNYSSKWLTGEQKMILGKVKTAMPEEFGLYVDWYKVQKAGALVSCAGFQKNQDKKYGKKAYKPEKGIWNVPMEHVGNFSVGPGVSVPILKRVAA